MGPRLGVRARPLGVALGAALLVGLGTTAVTAQAATAASGSHPRHNIAPKPDYRAACANYRANSTDCITAALAAINRARSMEHVRPMVLPDNFRTLSYAEQTFVITDLERVDRGFKPFRGLTAKLNQTAKDAAIADVDPAPAYAFVGRFVVLDYASNWTSNFGPLAGDYGWMYDDGYGSYNIDCATPSAPGCWAHRDVILTTYTGKRTLISGVGSHEHRGLVSIAQLFVAGNGPSPSFTYTWRRALRHGAGGRRHS